jgi:hypothetical protein
MPAARDNRKLRGIPVGGLPKRMKYRDYSLHLNVAFIWPRAMNQLVMNG